MNKLTEKVLIDLLEYATKNVNIVTNYMGVGGYNFLDPQIQNYDHVIDIYNKLNNIPDVANLWTNKSIMCFNNNSGIIGRDTVRNMIFNSVVYGINDTMNKIHYALGRHGYNYFYCSTINGIAIRNEALIDDIRIIPIENLPLSFWEDIRIHLNFQRYNTPQYANPLQKSVMVYSGTSKIDSGENRDIKAIIDLAALISYKMRCISEILPLFTDSASFQVHFFQYFDKEFFFSTDEGSGKAINEIDLASMKTVDIDGNGVYLTLKKFLELPNDLQKHLLMVLHRFNYACARHYHYDQAIELRIVIESLLASDRGTKPITHVISQRGAWLMGNNASDRVDKANFLKKAYGISSKAVHGNTSYSRSDQSLINDFRMFCAQIVFKIIDMGFIPSGNQWDRITMGENISEV